MLKQLCKTIVERSEAQKWAGKRRDQLALEFMIGAYAALREADHPDATHIGNMLAMVFTIRGFSEMERIAKS